MHQKKNSTWEIFDKPRDKNIVGGQWIFTMKYKAYWIIDKYKVKLVAKITPI